MTKSLFFLSLSVLAFIACVGIVFLVVHRLSVGEPEWNPEIKDDVVVEGIWDDQHHTLQLESNHGFTYQDNGVVTTGTWKREDWNLYLTPQGNIPKNWPPNSRFIRYQNRLRVLIHDPGDPDGWDGWDIGLQKE